MTPKPPKKVQAGWKIPESLRRRLNSHAEYLSSVDKPIRTEEMIAPWLQDRLVVEEKKRALRTLEIEESDLTKIAKNKAS